MKIRKLVADLPEDTLVAFTDGSCKGNPGPCGAGSCVFLPSGECIELKQPHVYQAEDMMSYDELLKHVETLKRENTSLHRELTDNSSHLLSLEHETNSMRETWCQGQGAGQGQGRDLDIDYSFNDEILCREHMATYEENPDLESQTQVDPVTPSNSKVQGQGQQRSQCQQSVAGGAEKDEEKEIVGLMKQLEQERSNLIQQIEAEDKNRKWYYDQMEMITRKIRSLPLGDNHSKQTRKHLDFEVTRLRDTMHESFGSNEQIGQRREVRVQRIRQIEMELAGLQKHREQISHDEPDGPGLNRRRSSSDSTGSGGSGEEEFEPEQVTMATQTESANPHEQQTDKGNNYWQNIYHGTWPINKDESGQGQSGQGPQDLASVMSFTSTNTSSSNGSRPQNQGQGQGQGQQLSRQQQQQQNQQQQQHHQPVAVQQQIHPQQLGTKVEMVYGLLSMLGTHDKDDMSRTLLAMSSSQDSCIAMRQSGCMPLLIQLLHGSDKDSALLGNTRGSKAARARASAALHNIVHSHPDDKRGRREARVLRLLEQIRAHCDQLRESSSDEEEEGKNNGVHSGTMDHHPGPAIASLMKLSFDEEHRHAICTLGGLHAIAELLQVDTEVHGDTSEQYNITMRRYACMALTNLTFGDGTNKALLCSMKTSMESLMLQLFSSNEELCQVAASVVRNLSWKADLASKKMLREVSAVTSLMQSAMRVGKETTLKSILSALWNLSAHCSENKADICAVCGALEFLISTLTYKSPSKTTAIIENGGGILRNVSSHIAVREDYRKILRLHGCLQILLKHLRSPSLTIVSNACGTLWNLSARCAEDQQALWEMGAVNMLRNLVHSKHKMISMGSSAALKNLLAARPNMKNVDLNKQNAGNRPSLHVRKQRALESEIDQNLSETCENVESPRDSPIENKKTDNGHFIYPVYPLMDTDQRRTMARGQFLPRSQSGDNALTLENAAKVTQRVSRSGSQDSVGSTHSDISHDRSRSNIGHKVIQNNNMGGSLDRNKDNPAQGQKKDGRTERNPLGAPNSRILQVMQEVAMHAGIEGQNQQECDNAVFKAPLPVMSYIRPQLQQQPAHIPQSGYHGNMMSQQPAAMYQRYMMSNAAGGPGSQIPSGGDNSQPEDDEKPLDYSLKYRENGQTDYKPAAATSQSSTQGNYSLQSQSSTNPQTQYNCAPKQAYYNRPLVNQRMQYNDAYAETDLDAPDQITDYSARYGVEYGSDQYARQQFGGRYGESDPNCADCKLEELRRYNDRLEQNMEDDQLKTFCTEDTPYLSTATSMTDLSTAVKILEEAENHCPADGQQDFNNDEIQNFSSKYGENGSQRGSPGQVHHLCQLQRHHDADKSSRSGSQTTDPQTGTTVITNYNLNRVEQQKIDSPSLQEDECTERSFHDNRNDDGPPDQMKTYCEEGTPLCFSRVSSLSSLHSSEANDKQDKRGTSGPLQSINEAEDLSNSGVKMPPPSMTPMSYRQKMEGNMDGKSQISNDNGSTLAQRQMTLGQRQTDVCLNGDSSEKEHKTVTFDDKVQETPMMFSRSTSLGSLSSFDTQSVHSSVFSEYSRRASEVVSPSELPDSPSETMPPSPRRTKSPERFDNKKQSNSARQELFPQIGPRQFTNSANQNAQKISPLAQLVRMNNLNRISNNETDSVCKSEAPVVYAEEGTPPVFDNLSEISGMLSDQYDINDKTLVEVKVTKDGHSSSSHSNQGSERYLTPNERGRNSSNKTVSVDSIQLHLAHNEMGNQQRDTHVEGANQVNVTDNVKSEGQNISDLEKRCQGQGGVEDDKGNASVSDVSEGEDDLLANIISSAMPNHSKKVRKSSSDNTARRKLSSSSKPDGGRSKGQGHSKSHGESPPTKSGIPTSSKNSTKSPKSSSSHNSSNSGNTHDKKKAMVAPLQHRDLSRVAEQKSALDTSVDSVTSYADEDTPFNVSNTQSVINRSLSQQQQQQQQQQQHHQQQQQHQQQQSQPEHQDVQVGTTTAHADVQSASAIIQKAESLVQYDGEEKCRTYATEDTPFSGSIPSSPRNDRKFKGAPLPSDMNEDCVTSFATEDTPFSGTAPGSPKFDRAEPFQPTVEMDTDSIKCYQTEDTPFSGSTMGSPKMSRNANINTKPAQNARVQNLKNVSETSQHVVKPGNKPKQATVPPMLDFSQDVLVSYATEDTPLNQSNLPSPKPTDQRPQLNTQNLQNMDFGDTEDVVKTFATEGTPLNYSRTGSFSDLSSINTNFEEKVKIDPFEPSATCFDGADADASAPSKQVADDSHSDNSSLMEDSEELLSEIIQSAMPVGKPGKSQKTSIDRKPEGADTKSQSLADSTKVKNPKSKVPIHFQPQRTSSLAQNNEHNQYGDSGDQVRTYAVEDTPANMSSATSLSDLTVDSSSTHNNAYKQSASNQFTNRKPSNSSTGQTLSYNTSENTVYGMSNDSVFLHSEFDGSNSLRVFKTEGTPQSFSCNESLSSLGIVDDDSSNPLASQIRAIAQTITKSDNQAPKVIDRSESRSSEVSNQSGSSGKELERHVIGQSSEEQSLVEENWENQKQDEMKKFGVEDTPVCFSRNSSLSSIHDLKDDTPIQQINTQQEPSYDPIPRQPSKDQKANYKMEHTPICFSRNSSLSSLSIHSDDDDDPEDIALLEDCITSALPPRTRPTREERHRNSHRSDAAKTKNSTHTNYTRNNQTSSQRNYSSADELETPTTHDSRYTNWRQQPHKSCDEIFRKPTLDARGRPCRRSRSQDSEKIPLKQHKDVSNKELAQNTKNSHKGSFDSLCDQNLPVKGDSIHRVNQTNAEVEKQRQQIISESQNLTRSIEHQVRALTRNELSRSAEKSDEHESEKYESPTDEQNFFMMCSGMTEISVENISKQSFPSSMAPDTDDDMLDSSLMGSFRFEDEESMRSSRDTTLTDRNTQRSCNSTLTEQPGQLHPPRTTMEASITSEDERALAENANLVMAEMVYSRMGISGSTVDDDRFIENETLSLVSNEYMSDTASEASVTWSAASSDRTTGSDRTNTEYEISENQPRRPRILKPGDKSERKQPQTEADMRGVRGKRKPLYSSHSVAGMVPSSAVKAENFGKNRSQSVTTAAKTSPRSQQLNTTANAKKAHTLRTQPQACSTPVKAPTGMKQTAVVKPTLPQRKTSLEQKSPITKPNTAAKTANVTGKSPKGGKAETGEVTEKPRTLSKQGTFVKETSNKNAPVISSENSPVSLRQKKNSSSSLQSHRNSSGSSRSNTSESLANDSFDSNPEQNTKISVSEKESFDSPVGEKKSKLRRSLGTTQLTNSRKSLNQSLSPATKIPSPSKTTLNKTGSSGNLKKNVGKQSQVLKSNSGTSLAKSSSGSSLTKTGSNSSLKKLDMKQSDSNTSLRNSRPSTPVSAVNNKKGTIATTNNKSNDNNKKQNGNKISGSKLPGLIKKDKNTDSKQKPTSKLPVAKTKGLQKEDLNQSVHKREASPKPAINRNTVILSESSFDGLCRSSTYDKLNATNELSQIPSHDRTHSENNRTLDESHANTGMTLIKSSTVFKEDTLDKTCRDMSKFEVGVEYNLDDAWATHVEKSIEVMSRSIEENKGQQSHLYGVEAELSKLDLSDSPSKRLSKSESMSEIELEYGSRVNSGTWTKKRSRNDSSLLPNADETSRTLPLKKRSESLNFSRMSSEGLSPYDSDYDDTDVWIRRDDKMRCSDITGKLKKKGLKGSSSFLPLKNVVSKVFGSKKVDKQSKSMIVTEKEQKGARKDTKLNKSEIKASKAELKAEAKQQKALQKAEAKMLKAEQKASKKESKLIKNNKSGVLIGNKDSQCQNINSSLTSLKKSAEDLIDIDKSDDEIFENQSGTVYQTASLGRRQKFSVNNGKPVNDISSSNYQYKSQSAEQLDQVRQSGSGNKIVNQSFSDRTEQNGLNASQSSVSNKSVKQSPTFQHATKTEMLLARRQHSLLSTTTQSDDDEDGKPKCIVTTV